MTGMNNIVQTGRDLSNGNNASNNDALLAEILNELRKPSKAYITLTDLEKAQDTKQTIESAVTRNRSI